MAKLKCGVCETEFPAIRERHYVVRDRAKTGIVAIFFHLTTSRKSTTALIARIAAVRSLQRAASIATFPSILRAVTARSRERRL